MPKLKNEYEFKTIIPTCFQLNNEDTDEENEKEKESNDEEEIITSKKKKSKILTTKETSLSRKCTKVNFFYYLFL